MDQLYLGNDYSEEADFYPKGYELAKNFLNLNFHHLPIGTN